MNWFLQTPMRGGELNGVYMNGYAKDNNFFFEFLSANGKRGLNQYAGTVEGNRFWFFVRMKPTQKTVLIIFGILVLIAGIVVPLVDPEKAKDIGKFCGGVVVVYLLILLSIKSEAKKVKKFITQMLEAQKIS